MDLDTKQQRTFSKSKKCSGHFSCVRKSEVETIIVLKFQRNTSRRMISFESSAVMLTNISKTQPMSRFSTHKHSSLSCCDASLSTGLSSLIQTLPSLKEVVLLLAKQPLNWSIQEFIASDWLPFQRCQARLMQSSYKLYSFRSHCISCKRTQPIHAWKSFLPFYSLFFSLPSPPSSSFFLSGLSEHPSEILITSQEQEFCE